MSEIIVGKLYLGDGALLIKDTKLIEWKITDIINCADDIVHNDNIKKRWKDELKIESHHIPMVDSYDYNLLLAVSEIAQLLNILISAGQVCYVHCVSGINRSAAAVVAYLILYQTMSYEEAYVFVNNKRPGILANKRFVSDLQSLAKSASVNKNKEEIKKE